MHRNSKIIKISKKQNPPSVVVQNCTFTGIKWDEKALESVNNISKALLNMTELFKSQNIKIDSMLRFDNIK